MLTGPVTSPANRPVRVPRRPAERTRSVSDAAAPTEVVAARVILTLQGLLLVGVGVVLAGASDPAVPAWLGTATVVEGALRVVLAGLLRRGARAVRVAAVVLCAISAVLGLAAGGLSILGALLGIVVVRCLSTAGAKEHFNG